MKIQKNYSPPPAPPIPPPVLKSVTVTLTPTEFEDLRKVLAKAYQEPWIFGLGTVDVTSVLGSFARTSLTQGSNQ